MSVYQSKFLIPNSTAVDFSSNQTFTSVVQGSVITHYQLLIKRVDTNATLYDSTKLAATPNLYNDATLSIIITGGTITYKGEVKQQVITWSGSDYASTREILFYSDSLPSVSLTVPATVTAKSVTFTSTYTQAESVGIKKYIYYLYNTSNEELDNSGDIYSAELAQEFDGFVDGLSYKVECVVTDIHGTTTTTGKQSFTVDYSKPILVITPSAVVNNEESTVSNQWAEAIQIIGTSSGTISYVTDHLEVGNTGLKINSSGSATWTVAIPAVFTQTVLFNSDGFTSGRIIKYDGAGGFYEIGYDGNSFYFIIEGNKISGKPLTLGSGTYLIAVKYNEVMIIQNNTLIDHIKLLG